MQNKKRLQCRFDLMCFKWFMVILLYWEHKAEAYSQPISFMLLLVILLFVLFRFVFYFVSWNINGHLSKKSTGLQPFLLMPDVKGWCFSLQHANLPFVLNEKNIWKHESQGSQGYWQAPTEITTGREVQGAQYIYKKRRKKQGVLNIHTFIPLSCFILNTLGQGVCTSLCICEWIIKGRD